MPLISDVVAGTIIQSAWGNNIRDRTVEIFASKAELDGWSTAPEGAHAYTTSDKHSWVYQGGAWTWDGPQGLLAFAESAVAFGPFGPGVTVLLNAPTLTLPVNRKLRLEGHASPTSGSLANDFLNLYVMEGSTFMAGANAIANATANGPAGALTPSRVVSVVVGAHTFSLAGSTSYGGLLTLQPPVYLAIEDIGPA